MLQFDGLNIKSQLTFKFVSSGNRMHANNRCTYYNILTVMFELTALNR